jgi:hypothetical protein
VVAPRGPKFIRVAFEGQTADKRIFVATAEGVQPGGALYHLAPFEQEALRQGVQLVTLVPDRSVIDAADQHRVMTPEEVVPRPGDAVVVTSAEAWPVRAATHPNLAALPRGAAALTYLRPEQPEGADKLDLANTAQLVTAPSELQFASFRQNVGLPADHPHQIVGAARLDSLPTWSAAADSKQVAILTSVRGETPGADMVLTAAKELQAAGYEPVVCAHPREDLRPYLEAGLTINDRTQRSTLEVVAESPYVAGAIGSVNADIAALTRNEGGQEVGPKVVALVSEDFKAPPHLPPLCEVIGRGEPAVEAMKRARPAGIAQSTEVNGPIGGAAEAQVAAWATLAEGGLTAQRDGLSRSASLAEVVGKFTQGPTATSRVTGPAAATSTDARTVRPPDRGRDITRG